MLDNLLFYVINNTQSTGDTLKFKCKICNQLELI